MDYYEELGVPRGAPVEEIRRAWRNLARLLHPDQQQDEGLRLLAERQMQRLNEVCAVLTDPIGRLRYDESLFGDPPPPPIRRRVARRHRWLVAAALFAVAMIAAATLYPRPAPRLAFHELPAVAAMPVVPTPEPAPRPNIGRVAPVLPARQKKPPPAAVLPAPAERPPEITAKKLEPPPPPDVPSAVAIPQPAVARPRPTTPPASDVAGAWFYVPQKAPAAALLYAPEFIEVFITETAGVLHGRYRARYKVGDRALSGTVRFSFEGRQNGNPIVLGWTAPDGSSGEIRLRLVTDDALQVSWQAKQLGASMSLASGTATLARRREL